MIRKEGTVCPWCQTEIIEEPEDSVCPYCLNELGDYRTMNIALDVDEDDAWHPDLYGETVEAIADSQEEAPLCSNCQERMLFAGTGIVDGGFAPQMPAVLNRPFLEVPFRLDIYVCPSCFKIEHYLAKDDQLAMVQAINPAPLEE